MAAPQVEVDDTDFPPRHRFSWKVVDGLLRGAGGLLSGAGGLLSGASVTALADVAVCAHAVGEVAVDTLDVARPPDALLSAADDSLGNSRDAKTDCSATLMLAWSSESSRSRCSSRIRAHSCTERSSREHTSSAPAGCPCTDAMASITL